MYSRQNEGKDRHRERERERKRNIERERERGGERKSERLWLGTLTSIAASAVHVVYRRLSRDHACGSPTP
jgi:hypothetical protein